jgi:hypothetical protein
MRLSLEERPKLIARSFRPICIADLPGFQTHRPSLFPVLAPPPQERGFKSIPRPGPFLSPPVRSPAHNLVMGLLSWIYLLTITPSNGAKIDTNELASEFYFNYNDIFGSFAFRKYKLHAPVVHI